MERVEGLDAHLREESLNIKTVQKLCKNLEERERERERERARERRREKGGFRISPFSHYHRSIHESLSLDTCRQAFYALVHN
jgi:hypothetical protein